MDTGLRPERGDDNGNSSMLRAAGENHPPLFCPPFRPLRDHILVRPVDRVASDRLAVVLHERPNLGWVVAVGPGPIRKGKVKPLDVQVGELVRFGEFMFPEWHHNGVRYLVLQEADVAGVVEQTSTEHQKCL